MPLPRCEPNAMSELPTIVLHHSVFTADYDWNARFKARTLSRGPQADELGDANAQGITGLASILATEGQNTAGDLRTLPDGTLSLVTGFRRLAAIVLLEEGERSVLGLKPGEMRVCLRGLLTEFEARKLNLSENVNRQNLTGPEFVAGIRELRKADPNITSDEIALLFAKSPEFIANALNILERAVPELVTAWEKSPTKPIPIGAMSSIAHLPYEAQPKAYKDAVLERVPADQGGHAPKSNVSSKARDYGTYLGTLVKHGIITFPAINDDLDEAIGLLVPFNRWHVRALRPIRETAIERFRAAFEKARR